jgi:carbonic anhydrase/acetyltransferase-like protein (isoleucine patch superfamily)
MGIRVGNEAWIGANTTVLDRVRYWKWDVGAGSIVQEMFQIIRLLSEILQKLFRI